MSYAFAFLLMFFPLVIFHEFGHFIVAKLAGIRVTKFAFGFGRELFRFHFKGTDFRWNLIPLGGYVDLMGEVSVTGQIPDDPAHFYNRPKWIRFLVMVMGPVFNLILAFLLFWTIHAQPQKTIRLQEYPLTIGYVDTTGPEYSAGLRPGDQILSINGIEIDTFDGLFKEIVFMPNKTAILEISRGGIKKQITYEVVASEKDGVGELNVLPAVFLRVGEVVADSPAERAGLLSDDFILRANGENVYYSWKNNMLSEVINKLHGGPVPLSVLRGDEIFDTEVVPELNEEDKFLIGIMMQFDVISSDPTWQEAAVQGWATFKNSSTMILKALKLFSKGELSVKSFSGPIELGRVAKQQLDLGWVSFLGLMAILSLNLGIFNLLPIPVLDGGEIFVLLIEGVTRREFSLQTKVNIKIAGFLVILCLMAVILVSDALKLFA